MTDPFRNQVKVCDRAYTAMQQAARDLQTAATTAAQREVARRLLERCDSAGAVITEAYQLEATTDFEIK
jgi:hypothetical protein